MRARYASLDLDSGAALRPFLEGLPALASDWHDRVAALDPPADLKAADDELLDALANLETVVKAIPPTLDLSDPASAAAIDPLVGPNGAAERVTRALAAVNATGVPPAP